MKKLFFALIGISMMLAAVSCQCGGNNEPQVEAQGQLVVENVVSMDKQDMYLKHGGDYRLFEVCIVLEKFLDAEDTDATVEGISNVFQVVTPYSETCYDTEVILYSHTRDTSAVEVREHAFWVGDSPLNDEAITVTFAEAYERLVEANVVRPHSRHCVLRKEVGPTDANPQYVFGNPRAQVYVDAVTGEVATDNPAFRALGFKMPLGEWP